MSSDLRLGAQPDLRIDETMMSLFRSDISRNFGLGFVLGAVIVMGSFATQGQQDIVAPVQAATIQAPMASN